MTKLKPCPFCGHIAKSSDAVQSDIGQWWVECKDCGARGPVIPWELDAIMAWNKRKEKGT